MSRFSSSSSSISSRLCDRVRDASKVQQRKPRKNPANRAIKCVNNVKSVIVVSDPRVVCDGTLGSVLAERGYHRPLYTVRFGRVPYSRSINVCTNGSQLSRHDLPYRGILLVLRRLSGTPHRRPIAVLLWYNIHSYATYEYGTPISPDESFSAWPNLGSGSGGVAVVGRAGEAAPIRIPSDAPALKPSRAAGRSFPGGAQCCA